MSILLRVSKVTIVLTLSILSGCESDLTREKRTRAHTANISSSSYATGVL